MLQWITGRPSQKDSAKNAIIDMREKIEMLEKRQRHLLNQMEEQEKEAKKYVTSNKKRALAALRKKKQFEKQLETTEGQQEQLQRQLYAIEDSKVNAEMLRTMAKGAAAMKDIHGNLNIDKVDSTMDDIRDQIALGNELSEAMTRPLGNELDEDELDEELAELEQQELDAKMTHVGNAPQHNLPGAVSVSPEREHPAAVEEEEDEDAELRRLQEEMTLG